MRLGVRHKLALLGTLILVGVSFGFLLLNLWLARGWLEEDLQARVVIFAQALAATISSRQEFESGAVLQEQVRRIQIARQDLLQLDVLAFRPGGTIVVATTTPERRLPFTRRDALDVMQGGVLSRSGDRDTGPYWDVLAPISVEGAVAGAVGARFSSLTADRLTRRMGTANTLLTVASVVVMAGLMSLTVRSVVDRPIQGFLGAIERIRGGDTAVTVEVGAARDEFGLLAEHFNDMVSRTRWFNDELQRRVDAATGELARRYQQVQQLNAQLFDLQRRLTHSERLAVSGRILAEVAHEVGTPLHSVAGHLELFRKDLPAHVLASDVGRRLAIIETQVARVIEIIARLLALTRRHDVDAGLVDLNQLVGEMGELVGPGVASAGLTLDVSTAPDLPLVLGEGDSLRQVILNLVMNAIDATPVGGRVTLTTAAVEGQPEAELIVSDTGSGIRPEDRPRVFEPFFSTKPAGRGTGLGLFITAEIVRTHQGRIEVTSREGHGSVFRVRLPTVESAG